MKLTPVLAVVLFIAAAAAQGVPANANGDTNTSPTHTKTTTFDNSNVTGMPTPASATGLGIGQVSVTSDAAASAVPSASKSGSGKSSKKPVGAIVGGIVGGIVLLVIAGAAIFFVRMRRKKGRRLHNDMGHEQGGVLDKNLSLEDPRVSGSASALATAGQGVPMMSTYDRSARGDGERTRGDANGGAASLHERGGSRLDSHERGGSRLDSHERGGSRLDSHERGGSRLDAPLENRTHEVVVSPAEIHSREVDEDGVSVQSFDIHGTNQESSVPRLPLYTRGSVA